MSKRRKKNRAGVIVLSTVLILLFGTLAALYHFKEEALDYVEQNIKNSTNTASSIPVTNLLEPEVIVFEEEADSENGVYLQTDAVKKLQDDISAEAMNNYCYEHLDDDEKTLYAEILNVLETLSKDVIVSTRDPEELKKVFSCVMLDHPEIFYVTGYSITKYTRGDTIEEIAFTGKYTMERTEAEEFKVRVRDEADQCIAMAPEGGEYEKVKYIYEWLINRCDYVVGAENNQNILSVFVTNKTVCQGYAKAAQYLLNRMGMFCILCEGEAMGSEAHVWNIVRVDGEYYYMDVTWGDASYTMNNRSEYSLAPPEINYEYMLVPYSEIAGTHMIQETVALPVCNSMRDNYYVREGLYFDEVSSAKLEKVFDKGYDNGWSYVPIKCDSSIVYQEMERYLIDREHIFDFLRTKKVDYMKVDERNYFLFYLGDN